ncbi:DMT family transporter [Paracoccus marinus]|uniref:DMT family transporter n=1 Tax=Paracoccus marinus TaxID=288426 RepID=UPI001FE3C2E1|nr:DMT family transporter [Paracoccus marinus]GLS80796.1 ABC transporter permease [Paracoccus marinus]
MSDAIRARMSGREWGLMLLLSALWGGSFFFIGTAVRDMPVLTIVLLRVALAAAALWIVVLATGRRVPRGAATWGAFLVMGLLNNVIPFALIVWGQKQIPSGLASILNASTPLWTVLVAGALLSDERASVRKLAGVVMGLGGVAVMMGIDVIGGQHPLLPQLAVVCASISYGFSAWWGRRFRQIGVDPMVTAAGMLTASTLVLAIPVLALNGPPVGYPATSWAAVAALALLSSALAYVIYFRILASAGATNISLVTFLVPVSAILLGWLFLDERLGFAQLIGMALIGAGLALIDGRLFARRAPQVLSRR